MPGAGSVTDAEANSGAAAFSPSARVAFRTVVRAFFRVVFRFAAGVTSSSSSVAAWCVVDVLAEHGAGAAHENASAPAQSQKRKRRAIFTGAITGKVRSHASAARPSSACRLTPFRLLINHVILSEAQRSRRTPWRSGRCCKHALILLGRNCGGGGWTTGSFDFAQDNGWCGRRFDRSRRLMPRWADFSRRSSLTTATLLPPTRSRSGRVFRAGSGWCRAR